MSKSLYAAFAAVLLLALVKLGCSLSPIKQNLPIGSPCMQSSDCGSQPEFVCATDHPGGYCEKDCDSNDDCPTESICVLGTGQGECRLKCDNASGCRIAAGYECKPASSAVALHASHNYCDAIATTTGGDAATVTKDLSTTPLDGATGG